MHGAVARANARRLTPLDLIRPRTRPRPRAGAGPPRGRGAGVEHRRLPDARAPRGGGRGRPTPRRWPRGSASRSRRRSTGSSARSRRSPTRSPSTGTGGPDRRRRAPSLPAASAPALVGLRRRSWICVRSVSQRDRAWAVTSSHWRRTSSSAGRSPRRMRSSSSSDLAAGRRRADEDDHDAEERRDHGEDRADHAVAGRVGAEEVRDVDRRADRVHREQRRAEDARTGGGRGGRSAWR